MTYTCRLLVNDYKYIYSYKINHEIMKAMRYVTLPQVKSYEICHSPYVKSYETNYETNKFIRYAVSP